MNFLDDKREQLILAIQAVIGVIVIILSVRGSARVQTAAAKKLAKRDGKEMAKLHKKEYKMRTKLMKQKYRTKMRNAKLSGKKRA